MKYKTMLVGSVPLSPAKDVFATVCQCLNGTIDRIPDGEQIGWVDSVRLLIGKHPALEKSQMSCIGSESTFAIPVQLYRLKAGKRVSDVQFGDFGIADNAIRSYAAFRALQADGTIPAGVKFQATIPGPASCGGLLELPEADVYSIIEPVLRQEIQRICDAVDHDHLTIQIDLAVEVEKVEYDRRPGEFQTPVFGLRDFSLEGSTAAVARLAAVVPADVELGFHLCAMWHVYKSAGQDLNVHVDYANLLTSRVSRPIRYMHIPTTPEYDEAAFAPLKRLQLQPDTELYLGLIHEADGSEGAHRRIQAAEKHLTGFGIANFCGLSQWDAKPESVVPMLRLHQILSEGLPGQ